MKTTVYYLVDTDIMIYWLTGAYPQVQHKMDTISNDRIFVSAITVAELYFGAYNSSRTRENCVLLDNLIHELRVLPFDEKAGAVFGQIKTTLKQNGQIINDSDLFIAATALSQKLTLVTNNEKHFGRIAGLAVENWTKSQIGGARDS